MRTLLVVGAGLFGSQAAAYARQRGLQVKVFDPILPGAASAAAAGLFSEKWAGKKWREHFDAALPLLDRLFGIQRAFLADDQGLAEPFHFVPPSRILEPAPLPLRVSAVGDGWLDAGNERHEGWVYLATGVWSADFLPGLNIRGKAGSSFLFSGESQGRLRPLGPGRQALAFVRDPGTTFFSDGAAVENHTQEHDRLTLGHAADMGLVEPPLRRLHGSRPYTPGGPLFQRLGDKTWLATGGRKMGTILGASYARRLIERELRLG